MTTKKLFKKPISVANKNFESIRAFCNEYGLKYSTVNRLLNKGHTPNDILAGYGTLPASTRYNENSARAQKCSYDGVNYPSLVVAADTLGIDPDKILQQQKLNPELSIDKAIAAVMQNEEEKNPGFIKTRRHKHVGEITIAGKKYGSMQEALLAYGMNYNTIVSRMEREHISFEEALRKGDKARKHIEPYYCNQKYINYDFSKYPKLQLPDDNKNLIVKIIKTLKDSNYIPNCLYDENEQIGIILIEESLHTLDEKRTIMLTFNYPQSYYPLNIEMCIPNLITLPESVYNEIHQIQQIQNKYLNAVIAINRNTVLTRWLYTATNGTLNIRQFLIYLHHFIGTSAAIFDEVNEVKNQLLNLKQ